MKIAKLLYSNHNWEKEFNHDSLDYKEAQLVLGFGESSILLDPTFYKKLKEKFPKAEIALTSSSGEIFCDDVYDLTVCVTALQFSSTQIKTAEVNINHYKNSFDAGEFLLNELLAEDLKWIFVLSDGSHVNGSELVKGLNSKKPDQILITGGLAGDGARFEKTYVGLNKVPEEHKILAIGFYGNDLQLSHSSLGGWETFGLERTVTKSKANILYEFDGKNALDLYKKYLGKYADELPSSALLFPLSVTLTEGSEPIVRTILSINEEENYMVFAGDIPQGSKVRFMKANFDRLIDAANIAALDCCSFHQSTPKLAILISCVGRKLILGNRTGEEVEAVTDVLGKNTAVVGFYSYGEISPIKKFANCELHNQTITITGINEKD